MHMDGTAPSHAHGVMHAHGRDGAEPRRLDERWQRTGRGAADEEGRRGGAEEERRR